MDPLDDRLAEAHKRVQAARDTSDLGNLIAALASLAKLLDEEGRTVEALPVQREAVDLAAANFQDEVEAAQRERLIFYMYRCGLSSEALDEIEIASALVMDHPTRFSTTIRLADTAANVMDELGKLDFAVSIIEKATSSAREALSDGNTSFKRPLAALLDKQASLQHRLRHYDEAVSTRNEALSIWRSFEQDNVEDRISLARSLHGLSLSLLLCNQLKEANESLYEALQLIRDTVANKKNYQDELPPVLMSLATFYEIYDKPEPAISAAAEAVDIYHALHAAHPVRYSERLAMALDRLSALLSGIDAEAAMSLQEECVDLLRDVADRDISRRLKLVDGLITLSQRQVASHSYVPARNNIDEAIETCEFLDNDFNTDTPLAKAYETLATLFLQKDGELHSATHAAEAANNAVSIRRRLHVMNTFGARIRLIHSLEILMECESLLGHFDATASIAGRN